MFKLQETVSSREKREKNLFVHTKDEFITKNIPVEVLSLDLEKCEIRESLNRKQMFLGPLKEGKSRIIRWYRKVLSYLA